MWDPIHLIVLVELSGSLRCFGSGHVKYPTRPQLSLILLTLLLRLDDMFVGFQLPTFNARATASVLFSVPSLDQTTSS
ncbi:hypothetical protein VNO77_20712 [Canavalia gladiata]|uniref:Uncharacterized protein n=1 Tax=Canavalia gladiata TaxID=3824 RepID=A0AAN9LPR3_CANGL